MIEVWEKLDCENVGAKEIIAIEKAVREHFGESAVESPMTIARLLAERAELRHSEIMKLFVDRNQETEYDSIFRTILKFETLRTKAHSTIRDLENVRHKFTGDEDKTGLRLLRETALRGKKPVINDRQ